MLQRLRHTQETSISFHINLLSWNRDKDCSSIAQGDHGAVELEVREVRAMVTGLWRIDFGYYLG